MMEFMEPQTTGHDWQTYGNNLYANYPEADLDLRIYEQVIYKKVLLREPWKQ